MTITTTKDGKLFWIKFDRPAKYNGLTQDMMLQLKDAFYAADENTETSITILTGNGKFFTAGADFSPEAMSDGMVPEKGTYANFKLWIDAMIVHTKPIVALVNGPAVGIGVTCLGLCDAVIASDTAYFYTPFSVIGLCAEGTSSYIFPRSYGHLAASRIAIFSEKILAHEAAGFGLVNRVISHEKFESETRDMLNRWSELSPESMKTTKKLMRNEEEIGKLLYVNKLEHDEIIRLMQDEKTLERIMSKFRKSKI